MKRDQSAESCHAETMAAYSWGEGVQAALWMHKQLAPACLCFVVAVEVVAVGWYGWIRAMELGWLVGVDRRYGAGLVGMNRSKILSSVSWYGWIIDIEFGWLVWMDQRYGAWVGRYLMDQRYEALVVMVGIDGSKIWSLGCYGSYWWIKDMELG